MLKFTANYAYTNSNFTIQNLPQLRRQLPQTHQSLFAVLKNILQRGAIAKQSGGVDNVGSPTRLSQRLEDEDAIGLISEKSDFTTPLYLISSKKPLWSQTIKGDTSRGYYPAREFFDALPELLGEYGFVQQLICPEVAIHDIDPNADSDFTHQQVDFYCPQAKLIIEIDGGHHTGIQDTKDRIRDEFFERISRNPSTEKSGEGGFGILTVRIKTKDWREKTANFDNALAQIKNRLHEKYAMLRGYKKQHEHLGYTDDEIHYKLLPTAVLRFQLLLLELLIRQRISLTDEFWHFIVKDSDGLSLQSDKYARFASMAVMDLFEWLKPLCQLMKIPFEQPELRPIVPVYDLTYQTGAIHVDFSLLQRYTDENKQRPETLYVRTDYFSANQDIDAKNYFRVSITKPINYNLENTSEVEKILEFFLSNLFGKEGFREGQLPIILNALNRRDTIGLLPTGGGKSLCYQLPCLLQPAVSLVVCPIKSLMYDQKDNLDKAFITRTNYITGELSAEEKQAIQRQFEDLRYFFIWVSPERFQVKTFRDHLKILNAKTPLAYVVVDEVHCMSEWGHDFRTSYLNLTKTVHECCPETKLIGLTATASLNVLKNIRIEFARSDESFNDEDVKTKLDFSRPELQFEVINDKGKKADTLNGILKKLYDSGSFLHQDSTEEAGLIFTPFVNGEYGCYKKSNDLNTLFLNQVKWYAGECPTKNEFIAITNASFDIEELFIKALVSSLGNRLSDSALRNVYNRRNEFIWESDKFHKAGHKMIQITKLPVLCKDDFELHKKRVQKDYKNNKFPLMVATKAFGMGIDKPNIAYTFHYGLPGSMESLYQEAGRAGRWNRRDEKNKDRHALCQVLFSPESLEKAQFDDLFDRKTTLARLREISDSSTDSPQQETRGDALRQLFLFQGGQDTVESELDITQKLLAYVLTEPKAPSVNILWKQPHQDFLNSGEPAEEFFRRLGAMSEGQRKTATEKALYRLSILGIVQNWTTDFICHFAVRFSVLTEEQALENLMNHIVKYKLDDKDNRDLLRTRILETAGKTTLQKCMHFLLVWTWETITYSRRESLRQLYVLCTDFESSKSFKHTLDNVFRVDETTIIVQYIADNPKNFKEWAKAFQQKDGSWVNSEKVLRDRNENLSRFLISNIENLGIDAISGIYRLALNEFDDLAGRKRLEQTLSRLNLYFDSEQQQQALQTIVQIGIGLKLSDAARYELANSIETYYPNSYNWTSVELDIIHIPQLTAVNERLNNLNKKLHDQLSKIR